MLTREQQYAARVFQQVTEFERQAEKKTEKKTKYGSMAHKLPVLIRVAGLAQALHFVESRGDDNQRLLLKHLALTLDFIDGEGEKGLTAKEQLLESSRTSSLPTYMRLTHQALSALQWYKRFAQSVLKVEAGQDDASSSNGR